MLRMKTVIGVSHLTCKQRRYTFILDML